MNKFSLRMVLLCLASVLTACGGGSSSNSGEPSQERALISPEANSRWEDLKSTAHSLSESVDRDDLSGLWVMFVNVESSETDNSGDELHEKDQVMNVFQIAYSEAENEIEIKDCSGDFWPEGEIVSFATAGNSYNGTTGGFELTETRVLGVESSNPVSVKITSNTQLSVSDYDVDFGSNQSAKGSTQGVVAYKVRASSTGDIGAITDGPEKHQIFCAKLIQFGVESLTHDTLVAQGVALNLASVDGTSSEKQTLQLSDSVDGNGVSTRQAAFRTDGKLLSFEGADEVSLSLGSDLSLKGALGNDISFEVDTK